MSLRKYASGSEKWKKRKRVDELIESQKGAMDKFLRSNTGSSRTSDEWAIVAVEEQTNVNDDDQCPNPTEDNVDINEDDNNVSGHENIFNHLLQNLLVLMSNRFLLRIFMIQEIGIILITKLGTY